MLLVGAASHAIWQVVRLVMRRISAGKEMQQQPVINVVAFTSYMQRMILTRRPSGRWCGCDAAYHCM